MRKGSSPRPSRLRQLGSPRGTTRRRPPCRALPQRGRGASPVAGKRRPSGCRPAKSTVSAQQRGCFRGSIARPRRSLLLGNAAECRKAVACVIRFFVRPTPPPKKRLTRGPRRILPLPEVGDGPPPFSEAGDKSAKGAKSTPSSPMRLYYQRSRSTSERCQDLRASPPASNVGNASGTKLEQGPNVAPRPPTLSRQAPNVALRPPTLSRQAPNVAPRPPTLSRERSRLARDGETASKANAEAGPRGAHPLGPGVGLGGHVGPSRAGGPAGVEPRRCHPAGAPSAFEGGRGRR
jgi:hypothetical protein